MNVFEKLKYYLDFPFVQYAIIAGVLISVCASLLGVILVLKKYSYIGDGLSHVAFLGLAIASILNLTNDMPLIMIITILSAIILLCLPNKSKIKSDAAIAILAVSSLAIGYLLMNVFPQSSNISGDVCTTLFGSMAILTLTKLEVYLCVIISIIVVLVFVFTYNRLFAVTFDEDFAKSRGMNVTLFNVLIAILIGAVVVLSMKLVGSLLTTALIVFPALTSMRYCRSYKTVIISSLILAMVSSFLGIIIAILLGTPVGSTIVCFELFIFLIALIIGKMLKR